MVIYLKVRLDKLAKIKHSQWGVLINTNVPIVSVENKPIVYESFDELFEIWEED